MSLHAFTACEACEAGLIEFCQLLAVTQIDGQIGTTVQSDWRGVLVIRRNGGHHRMLSVLDHGAAHGMRVGPAKGQQ